MKKTCTCVRIELQHQLEKQVSRYGEQEESCAPSFLGFLLKCRAGRRIANGNV